MAILIFFFGVPHGAFDLLYICDKLKVHKLKNGLMFALFYVLAMVLVVVIWLVAPVSFFLGFIAISIFHFSGDPSPGTPAITRMLYGAAIILLPAFSHQAEVARLFAYLIDERTAILMASLFSKLSFVWLIGLATAIILRIRQELLSGLEILSVTLLALFASPITAFMIFFCCMHSARHILRTVTYFDGYPKRMILSAAIMPMFLTAVLVGVGWYFRKDVSLDTRIVQIVFVGLAALTVPHMVVIEPIRIRNWKKLGKSALP
jgi:Brp/Blh family beta-carotene 15,15'-monooxygenase